MDVQHAKSLITNKTRIIVPVHYAGIACQMDELMRIGNEFNIKIVESTDEKKPRETQNEKTVRSTTLEQDEQNQQDDGDRPAADHGPEHGLLCHGWSVFIEFDGVDDGGAVFIDTGVFE